MVNGKFRSIGDADCLALADRFMIRGAADILADTRRAVRLGLTLPRKRACRAPRPNGSRAT